jgi:cation diffusion facilitator family transporter
MTEFSSHNVEAAKEKHKVALSSVMAAIFLTGSKLIVGLLTGSLGILSEALHSGLDLVAAVMTFFAVKLADRPPDESHNYGHGKIENLSALFETLLLLGTCAWIVYEASERLAAGRHAVEVNIWSFAVIIISIAIDFTRSRALMKVAKKHNSQALEADALHFSSDILSSAVVIVGLVGAYFGYPQADSISALLVAIIVIGVSYNLGKKAIDALIDRSPDISKDEIIALGKAVEGVKILHDIKLRTSGANLFIDLNVHIDSSKTLKEAHALSHDLESRILNKFPNCSVHIHIEPEDE